MACIDTIHIWELWPKTRCIRVLWPFSWAIFHSFGVLGRFKRLVTPDSRLRVMSKNSSFSRFRDVFMSYWPCVPGRFARPIKYNTCLRDMTKNLLFLCLMVVFMSYCPQFSGSKVICMVCKDTIHIWEWWPKPYRFRVLWTFSCAIAHCFGVLGRFARPIKLNSCLRDMTKNSLFSCFLAIFMSYYP